MKKILIILTPIFIYWMSNQISTTPNSSSDEIEWLKKQIHPLSTFDPNDENFDDLKVLNSIVDGKKIIGLGEVTHGSKEIHKMHHRITKYLNQNHDFDILSIEVCMPEANKINEYTFNQKGEPIELIREMGMWIWRTQEFVDMIEWMQIQNKTNKQIKFSGFDMQFYDGAIEVLKSHFENNSETKIIIDNLSHTLDTIKANGTKSYIEYVNHSEKFDIEELLSKIQEEILSSEFDDTTIEWLLQNIRIIEQCTPNDAGKRDKYMAENVEWIQQQNPNSKLILWGHNGHIKKANSNWFHRSMGNYLDEKYKDEYLNIGFAFHQGSYSARTN